MLTIERRNYILDVLKRDGRVVALALSAELQVSIDTVRRDLRDLAAEGRLQRVHGGALPISPASDSFTERRRHLTPQKVSIAARAAQIVANGMVIVMGGGITNVQTAERFQRDLRATVITHNPPVAIALAEHPHVEVILVGGRLDKYTMVTVGPEAVNGFQRVRADLCFLGVCSLHPEVGISDFHYDDVQVERAMIACAAEVVALASSDKLNTAAPFVVGPLSELNMLVTDHEAGSDLLQPYRNAGIEIFQA
jgi:DeoR/GlpR family transcriptional regulator of sugar metabolism